MAINLYAHASVRTSQTGKIEVEASIPLSFVGKRKENMDTRRLLQPLKLAARETLGYVGDERSGINVDVDCEIPVGAGLGSSASTTIAIITGVSRARGVQVPKKQAFKIGFGPESYLHGKPSGVDHATCLYGGIIKFTRPDSIRTLRIEEPPKILVCDTGIHHSTRRLVSAVVRKSESKPRPFDAHLDEAEDISEAATRALAARDTEELGALMNRNQELLEEIGVSHPKLRELVKVARRKGALGAKLTGAGGGGSIIALCRTTAELRSIARALLKAGGIPYRVSMDREGARAFPSKTALKYAPL